MATITSITYTLMALLATVYIFLLFEPNLINYIYAIDNKFLQHMITTFVHLDGIHLLQNCISLYDFVKVEEHNQKKYVFRLLYFIVINSMVWHIANEFVKMRFAVGFSGVLFGLITLYPRDNVYGIELNPILYPFAMLLLMQLLIPNASFAGHFIGIFSAYVYMALR